MHLRQRVAPGDLEEAVAREGVERHVHPPQAGRGEVGRHALEQVAVGGQREVVEALDRGQQPDQGREIPAHERLAAGQAHIGDSERDEQPDEALDLLEAQDLLPVEPGQALRRHAVLAAEVAAIRDGHAQVADHAPVAVLAVAPRAAWTCDKSRAPPRPTLGRRRGHRRHRRYLEDHRPSPPAVDGPRDGVRAGAKGAAVGGGVAGGASGCCLPWPWEASPDAANQSRHP